MQRSQIHDKEEWLIDVGLCETKGKEKGGGKYMFEMDIGGMEKGDLLVFVRAKPGRRLRSGILSLRRNFGVSQIACGCDAAKRGRRFRPTSGLRSARMRTRGGRNCVRRGVQGRARTLGVLGRVEVLRIARNLVARLLVIPRGSLRRKGLRTGHTQSLA